MFETMLLYLINFQPLLEYFQWWRIYSLLKENSFHSLSNEVGRRFFVSIDVKFLYSYPVVVFLLSGFPFHIPDIWVGGWE